MAKILPDTNILIDTPEVLLNTDFQFVIPYTVLAELDGLKKNPDLRAPAQYAIKMLWAVHKEDPERITFVDLPNQANTNDEKIVISAKNHSAKLLSNDIGANVIAEIFGCPTAYDVEDSSYDKDYSGTREVSLDYKDASNLIGSNELLREEAEHYFGAMVVNEYVYYQMPNDHDKYSIWRLYDDGIVRLVKQSVKPFTAAGFHFVPADPVQACAIDAIMDSTTPLTVIEGRVGSGKTLCALVGALAKTCGQHSYKTYDRICVTRSPMPIDKQLQLGFMPGDLLDKMGQWILGIKSNLKFLYERNKKDMENEEAEKVFSEFFEALSLESIQGISLHNRILLVDEYELLSADGLQQVLSRIAEGSKVVLIGDSAQTYGANRGREGYKKLLPHLKGSPLVSYVKMHNIYRSELTEFVESIFK